MTLPAHPNHLPALLAVLHQDRLDGELILEQNDGIRSLHCRNGELVYLQSDAAGEQFGSVLLRQGVIDLATLNQLLASEERFRLGEKVVQWGLMSCADRDQLLQRLQEQVMVNALEHPVVHLDWRPGSPDHRLDQDLLLTLDHRHVIWRSLHEAHDLRDSLALLEAAPDWRWEGVPDLLGALADLPLTPATAYALSFLGPEPVSFETFLALSGLEPEDAARLLLALWALGGLTLSQGVPPSLPGHAPKQAEPARPRPAGVPKAASATRPGKGPEAPAASRPAPLRPPPLLFRPEQLPRPAPRPSLHRPPSPPPEPVVPLPEFLLVEEEPAAPPPRPSSGLPPDPFQAGLPVRPMDLSPAGPPIPAPDPFQPAPEPIPVPAQASAPPPEPEPELGSTPLPGVPARGLTPLERARAFQLKAKKLLLQQRTSEAIRNLEQAVQLDPGSGEAYAAWLLLGELRMTNPAWASRAISAFQSASRLRPGAAEPWAHMGGIYHRKHFQANAAACFRKALELDPSVPVPEDVDLSAQDPAPAPSPISLLARIKAMLGR